VSFVSKHLGKPIVSKEDPALLSGRGRYADDLPVAAGTLHAHVIRSPHPHAEIVRIDAGKALAQDGVWAVVTGEDVCKLSDPFLVALKAPVHQWSLAVGRVRYVGEPVALVVAESRYLAEDAAELVQIEYAPVEAVIDPLEARKPSAPLLHAEAKTNEISVREFHYGDAKSAFAQAGKIVKLTSFSRNRSRRWNATSWSRNTTRPTTRYDVLANFQGPFSTIR
jgi:2-furoyl-CoA dehydrogenase large subunit